MKNPSTKMLFRGYLLLILPAIMLLAGASILNSAEIIFTDSGQNLGTGASFTIATGDIDGDGDSDAVFTNYFGIGTNRVWTNDGTGQFIDSGQGLGTTNHGHGAALGDLDGDDDLDLFLVFTNSPDRVFLNDGSGIFIDSGQSLGPSDDIAMYVSLADIDNDGDLDAVVECYLHLNKVWINDGNGIFSISNESLGGTETLLTAIGDVDSDGDVDVFVTSYEDLDKVWMNDGGGHFADSGQRLGTVVGYGDVALGDLDGDGDLDAFVANIVTGNKIWLNNGSGMFDESGQYFGGAGRTVILGDLDSDDDIDAVTVHEGAGNYVWVNDGTATFTSAGPVLGAQGGLTVTLGDLDGDDDLDALVANDVAYGSSNKIYFNDTDVDTPVFLARFGVSVGENVVDVTWLVGTDATNDNFCLTASSKRAQWDLPVIGVSKRQFEAHDNIPVEETDAEVTYHLYYREAVGPWHLLRTETVQRKTPEAGPRILGVYPNPAVRETSISFAVGSPQRLRVDVYDVAGRFVARLTDDVYPVGRYTLGWDGRDAYGRTLPSGVYFYRLTAGDFKAARKMVLLK